MAFLVPLRIMICLMGVRLSAIYWQDVRVLDNRVEISIRRSEANLMGKGRKLLLGLCSITGICPVHAAKACVARQGVRYFFQHTDLSIGFGN